MESPCCTIHRFIWMVNGQCLYATRRIHFGHRRWKKNKKICTLVSQAISIFLTSGKKCRNYQKVYSSDDGISLPLFMVPNLCIDKKLGFDSPRCAVSFPRIGIGQMDSKQEFFAPSDVQVNLQCAMLISSAAYTHGMTRLQPSSLCEGSGPIVPVMENFIPFEGPVGV